MNNYKIIIHILCLLVLTGCDAYQTSLSNDVLAEDSAIHEEAVLRELPVTINTLLAVENYKTDEDDFFLTAIQSKFLQDTTAFDQLIKLGIEHCIDASNFTYLYSNYYNDMSPITRLTDANKLQSIFVDFEQMQSVADNTKESCHQIYNDSLTFDVFQNLFQNDSLYVSIETNYDLQNRIDYLNLGIVDIRRLVDTELYLPDTMAKDENTFQDYQLLGTAYCIQAKNYAFESLRQTMIANMVAFPMLIKEAELVTSFDKIISSVNNENRTVDSCNDLFVSSSAKDRYLELIYDYDNYYFYDTDTPVSFGDPKQNMLDYLNFGEIDSKRFIYDMK